MVLIFALTAAVLAVHRNDSCDPAILQDVAPPYDGELMPPNITQKARTIIWQITKYVDAYNTALNEKHIGYF